MKGSDSMSKVDNQIKELGYEEHVINLLCQYIVYENKKDDIEVTIEWSNEEQYCLIFAKTISRQKDWFGHPYQEPSGLTAKEYLLFNAKIQEMRES